MSPGESRVAGSQNQGRCYGFRSLASMCRAGRGAEGRGASWQVEERPEGKMGGTRKVWWRAGGTPRAAAFKTAARGSAPISAEEGRRKGEAGVVL